MRVRGNGEKKGRDARVLSPEEQLAVMREINRILSEEPDDEGSSGRGRRG